jgi:tetratricopeptide (TPR) repeat protein
MGRKRTRARQFIYFCFASLITLSLSGCATLEKMKVKIEGQVEAYQSLYYGKKLLTRGDYEGALNENLKILSLDMQRSPEDEALFNIGLIYAHPENSKKDYEKSLFYFKELTKDFPKSPWSERAKIWIGIFQEYEKLSQTIESLDQTHEKLNQMIETLNQTNKKSKQENIKIENREEALEFSLRSQKLLAQGNYEGALKENQRILSLSGQNPPGDEALFNMGLIYAHFGNPKKDYSKSIVFFKKLIKDYPQSPFVEQARMWTGTLQEYEKLSQTIQKLNQVIE